MDAISFINSRDVRKHLYDVRFEPDLLQSAYFIYQSKVKTIEEKHQAWEELCESTEDVILSEEVNKRWRWEETTGKSVHALIREHISREKQWMSYFYKKDESAFFTPIYEEIADRYRFEKNEFSCTYVDDGRFFSNFEAAQEAAKAVIEDDDRNEILSYRIRKHFVSDNVVERTKYITMQFNRNHEALDIDSLNFRFEEHHSSEIDDLLMKVHDFDIEWEFFKMMWFEIPLPFKRHDIVVGASFNWGHSREPFVLLDMVPWFYQRKEYKGKNREGYDDSDMNASGWSVGFYGDDTGINDDVMASYLDLEYYRGEYKGLQRLLPILAMFCKGDIDAWCYSRWTESIINESKLKRTAAEDAKCFGYGDKIIQMLEGKPSHEDND